MVKIPRKRQNPTKMLKFNWIFNHLQPVSNEINLFSIKINLFLIKFEWFEKIRADLINFLGTIKIPTRDSSWIFD